MMNDNELSEMRKAWLRATEMELQLEELEDAIQILELEGMDYAAKVLTDVLQMCRDD